MSSIAQSMPITETIDEQGFPSGEYTRLELFVERRNQGIAAGVELRCDDSESPVRELLDGARRRRHVTFDLERHANYSLAVSNARISMAYLSGGQDLLDRGVSYLTVSACELRPNHVRSEGEDCGEAPAGELQARSAREDPRWNPVEVEVAEDLGRFYEGNVRPKVHFEPFERWMNDPNGLCQFQGRYHMFYQLNPYGWQWDNMHWGHAASRDLIHWVHLPVVLFPQQELDESEHLSGGAFSGSAVPIDAQGRPCAGDDAHAMRFFLTRHIEEGGDPESLVESQTTCVSYDGIGVEQEHTVVERPLVGGIGHELGRDFRDPKVEWRFKVECDQSKPMTLMTVASNLPRKDVQEQHYAYVWEPGSDLRRGWFALDSMDEAGANAADDARVPALAGFVADDDTRLDDADAWRYIGPMFADTEHPEAFTYECPDFFPLDGHDVAVAALMKYRDGGGRFQPVVWYSGDLELRGTERQPRFTARTSGLCDFGTSFYAVQSFGDDSGRRIAIGWLADWFGVRREGEHRANGAMTLPRELHVRHGRLTSYPVREVFDQLLGKVLLRSSAQAGQSCGCGVAGQRISGNAYYARIELPDDSDFDIEIASEPQRGSLHLVRQDGITRIATHGSNTDSLHLSSGICDARTMEIFYDRGIAEIFLNHGEAAAAVLSACNGEDGMFQAQFDEAMNGQAKVEVRELRGIWD
ncbi:glycoside hydrolase family 32 protein [Bifidobacterium sp.]|uniref:glycoside hydrolase family 32 protein n=1 Tax=Bifidobacterium sp. TaxID=41200 RepID=UPI0039EA169C